MNQRSYHESEVTVEFPLGIEAYASQMGAGAALRFSLTLRSISGDSPGASEQELRRAVASLNAALGGAPE